jgi:predicted transcriptional regulator
MFYSLKYLYSGGIILNISKRYKEISKTLEISESNLRNKIKFLIELGFITKDNNNLSFIGFNKIQKKFKIKTFKSFKVEYKNPKELEILLKCVAIEENFKKQEYKVQEKIIKEELKRFGKIQARNTEIKIKKNIRKNIGPLTEQYKKREPFYSINKVSIEKKINPVATLSRKGISNLFNRKSKSTGSRFLNKIKKRGYVIQDEKRIDLIHLWN